MIRFLSFIFVWTFSGKVSRRVTDKAVSLHCIPGFMISLSRRVVVSLFISVGCLMWRLSSFEIELEVTEIYAATC